VSTGRARETVTILYISLFLDYLYDYLLLLNVLLLQVSEPFKQATTLDF